MFLRAWCDCRYQASRDDLAVFVALESVPAEFVNASRWFKHISALAGPQYVPSLV
jgi:elongation factor 1-beta